MKIGLQLYSVRRFVEEEGLDRVLEKLSAAGVTVAELAGFYDLSPEELSAAFKKHDIEPYSAHIGLAAIEDALPYIKVLGIKKVFIPIYRFAELSDPEGYKNFILGAKKAKDALSALGVSLGYHNHANELRGEEDLLDKISRDAGIDIELDIFWARAAGKRAPELIDKYGSRLTALHIKEMNKLADISEPTALPEDIVGEGASMSRECIEKARRAGVDTFILEVEKFAGDYIEYIEKSISKIKEFASV